MFGVVFIVIGNYLPKCKQNRTLGYKLTWTLANEENWNKTHRFGGKISVVCGLFTFGCVFLPTKFALIFFFALVLVNVIVPCAYSYHIYRKHVAQGIVYTFGKDRKMHLALSLMITVIALSACAIFMMTGDVHASTDENALYIEASYWPDKEIPLETIDSVLLVEDFDIGSKINGFGSPRLCVGIFKNDTHGTYTCYSYTKRNVTIVLTVDGEIYAIGLESDTATLALYETLTKEIG